MAHVITRYLQHKPHQTINVCPRHDWTGDLYDDTSAAAGLVFGVSETWHYGRCAICTDVTMMAREVACLVGDDGTGNLRTVVDQALIDDPDATPADIADIWRQATIDHAADRDA